MKKVGLTGGIGSGKSTVAQFLAAHFPIIDADKVSREVVEPGQPALKKLVEAFGEDIVDASGTLRRQALAQKAFASAEATQKLNDITHPAIKERIKELFSEYADQPAVIYDQPLLIELEADKDMDLVVVVEVPEELRIERLVGRGVDPEDAKNRIARQIDDETRRSKADVIIDNSGSLEELEAQINELVTRINQL